jgi:ribosomal subunit interface protein
MKVTLTVRHARFPKDVKEYARQKAENLEHYFDHLRKLEVILDRDGDGSFSAEMIASAVRGHVLVCHAVQPTASAAVDVAHEKMERQLVKFKEKLVGTHHRAREGGADGSKFNRRGSEPAGADAVTDPWW